MTKFFTEHPDCETESIVIRLKEKYCSVIHTSDPETLMEGIRAVGKKPELIANSPVGDEEDGDSNEEDEIDQEDSQKEEIQEEEVQN